MSKLIADIYCDRSGTFNGLKGAIERAVHAGARSLFILGCEANPLNLEQTDTYLASVAVPVFGGIFPQIIADNCILDRGYFVCALNAALPTRHVPLAFGSEPGWDVLFQDDDSLIGAQSVLVLFDARADQVDLLVKRLQSLGDSNKMVLGAAACKPCLFSNEGVQANSALLIVLPCVLQTEVYHAWHAMAGPFLVTHSEGRTIHTLNYQPAYDVYCNAVGAGPGVSLKDHPFGMESLNAEMLMRNIIDVKDGALVLSGEVLEQNMLYVMKTQPGALLDVVQAGLATKCVPASDRLLFLEARYDDELAGIVDVLSDNSTLIGAIVLGELANSKWGGVQFLNQALVLGGLQGKPAIENAPEGYEFDSVDS